MKATNDNFPDPDKIQEKRDKKKTEEKKKKKHK